MFLNQHIFDIPISYPFISITDIGSDIVYPDTNGLVNVGADLDYPGLSAAFDVGSDIIYLTLDMQVAIGSLNGIDAWCDLELTVDTSAGAPTNATFSLQVGSVD